MAKRNKVTRGLKAFVESCSVSRAAEMGPADKALPSLRRKGWQVVEQVSVGSGHYVLLRRVQGSGVTLESLTPRECIAVRHVCRGATNKEIAYLMGVAASTVGVLLWRASRKVGAVNRDHLIQIATQAYATHEARTDRDP